jgi:hypothetical protein
MGSDKFSRGEVSQAHDRTDAIRNVKGTPWSRREDVGMIQARIGHDGRGYRDFLRVLVIGSPPPLNATYVIPPSDGLVTTDSSHITDATR